MRRWTAISGLVAMVLTGCTTGPGADVASSTAATPPPSSTVASFAGDTAAPEFPSGLDWLNVAAPLTLASLRGKVVVLDFWTYGCINCIHILPDLERLETEFADELVVIGVHSAKFTNEAATENIRQVILRYGIDHAVVNDAGFEVWNAWGTSAWPTTVVVDPVGNVVGGHAGEGVYEVVQPVIASLVAEFDARRQIDRSPLDIVPEAAAQPNRALTFPGKVTAEPGGERLFIADTGRRRIVVADRNSGEVVAVYGSGQPGLEDGPATVASFDAPQGMALDDDGRILYVADTNNHAVRAVDTVTGAVTTVLGTGEQGWPPRGGTAPEVAIASPWDVVMEGTTLYIAIAGTHQIWSLDLETGAALPLVGSGTEGVANGPLGDAELAQPSGLALVGGTLYFADSESSSIRSAAVGEGGGETASVAGSDTSLFEFGAIDGVGDEARFQHPLGIAAVDADTLLVADTYNSLLRRVTPATGLVTTYLGSEPGWRDGRNPRFNELGGVSVDGGVAYVADTNNHAIRAVDLATGNTTTLVLKGIEAFEPAAGSEDYRGAIVTLDPVTVAPGRGTLLLDVALPPGYAVNAEAPSSLELSPPAAATLRPATESSADLTGTELPAVVPVLYAASGELIADVTLVYCEKTSPQLCLIEQIRFVVPLTVADGGTSTITLMHQVELPDR